MTTLRPRSRLKEKVLLPGEGHDWLAHDYAVLTLVVFGQLNEEFDDGVQVCSPWELHYKPRGAVHVTTTGTRGTRMFLLRLGERDVARLGIPAQATPRVFESGVPSARALAAFVSPGQGAAERSKDPGARHRELPRGELSWHEVVAPLADSREPRERPSWIREVYRRIRSENGKRHSLRELSSDFQVHPVYLARAFRRHYGHSIGSARRRSRIDRAVRELIAGDIPLADLALDLGYADQSHFARDFKRETGWTPARFRGTTARFGSLAPSFAASS